MKHRTPHPLSALLCFLLGALGFVAAHEFDAWLEGGPEPHVGPCIFQAIPIDEDQWGACVHLDEEHPGWRVESDFTFIETDPGGYDSVQVPKVPGKSTGGVR